MSPVQPRRLAFLQERLNAFAAFFAGGQSGLGADGEALHPGVQLAPPGVDQYFLERVHQGLRDLAADLSTDDLRVTHWQEYGGLIVNLRNVVTGMLPVARWRRSRAGDAVERRTAAAG